MYFFRFLALCFVSIFECLNHFVIPGIGIGFGTILVGLTLIGAVFRFIYVVASMDGINGFDNRSRDGVNIVNSPGSAVAISKDK